MTRPRDPLNRPNGSAKADLILEVGALYALNDRVDPYKSAAIREGRVIALSDSWEELNDLIGPATVILRDPGLVALPAFFDTHNHQLRTGEDLDLLQLDGARSIDDVITALTGRAELTPPGQWIIASRRWHETKLKERRLPTASELDRATTDHPVYIPRGGHVVAVNSLALEMAGISSTSPDPVGGTYVRDDTGAPNGQLIEFPAIAPVSALLPEPTEVDRVQQLRRVCAAYNARGIGAVREPGIDRTDFGIYQQVRANGQLSVRTDAMIRLSAESSVEDMLRQLDEWEQTPRYGDDVLCLSGVKIIVDGGIEGAAMHEPYANDDEYKGHLFLNTSELEVVVTEAVTSGWRVGCHAVGDRAIDSALDAFERVILQQRRLPPGWLVIEHGFLASSEQRRRAIELGIGITVQHPLLYSLAGNMLTYWGEERTVRSLPVREWVDEGAVIAAGSDSNVTNFDPLLAIWGLITRSTEIAGVQGPEHAVDPLTAFKLYTVAGAKLTNDEESRGPLSVGRFADLVVFEKDPLRCSIDEIPDLAPTLTFMNGDAVFDPQQRVTAS